MVFGPINRKPQERTTVRQRTVANTAQYIDVNDAGRGYGAISKAFAEFSGEPSPEEKKRQIELDKKALELYMVESYKNPEAAREASRSGDYSKFSISQGDRMARPAVVEGLHQINAGAMAPGLLTELSDVLDAVKPGEDANAVRQAFIENKIEGLPTGVSYRLIEAVTKGSNAKLAAVKQAHQSAYNGKQVNNLRESLIGELEGNGVPASMKGIEEMAAGALSALQGQDAAKTELVRNTVAEALVRAQVQGGPAAVRAAQLAAESSILFDGGSVNSSYDEDTLRTWRNKAIAADQDVITKGQRNRLGSFQRNLMSDPGNARSHWESFKTDWIQSGGNINGNEYLGAMRAYINTKASQTATQQWYAGQRPWLQKADATKEIGNIIGSFAVNQPTPQALTAVMKLGRMLDGGIGANNQHDLGQALMNPKSARGVITAIRAMQLSPEGKESQFRPSELLGEESRALAVYALMNGQDLAGDNLNARLEDALEKTKAMDNSPNAFKNWAHTQEDYRDLPTSDKRGPLAWYVGEHKELFHQQTGVPVEILEDPSSWSIDLRRYLEGNLNMAVNLDPSVSLGGGTLATTAGVFAPRRQFITIGDEVYPVKTRGVAKDAKTGRLVEVKDPGLPKDVAEGVLPDGMAGRPDDKRSGITVLTGDISKQPVEFPAGNIAMLPKGYGDLLGNQFHQRDIDDPRLLRAGEYTVIGGQTYFNPLEGKEGRKVPLDPMQSTFLEYTNGVWRTYVDNARASAHPNNIGVGTAVLNAIKGDVDKVIPQTTMQAVWKALEKKSNAVTLPDGLLFAGVGEFGKGAESGALTRRFMEGSLTEEDMAKLPPDYLYEYKRRILGGADGPLQEGEMSQEVLKAIMDEAGVPEVQLPTNAPTTIDTSEGPSAEDEELVIRIGQQEVDDGVARGEYHPSVMSHENKGPEAIKAANAENNFTPAAPQVAMATTKNILDSYPVTSWKQSGTAGLGTHRLAKLNNPLGVRNSLGQEVTFKDHNQGIQAGAARFRGLAGEDGWATIGELLPEMGMSGRKTVARHIGVYMDEPVDVNDPEMMTRLLQGTAEVQLGSGAGMWKPYIKAVVDGKPMELPASGTGDMVTGAGFRLDWPSSEPMLNESGIRDIENMTNDQAEHLTRLRVNELLKALPTWFDGAELSGGQRGALAQFLYTSPWSADTNRPFILTDKLINAVQSGDHERVAKLIRRETRVFRRGLNEQQKSLQRHAIKMDRDAIALRYLSN